MGAHGWSENPEGPGDLRRRRPASQPLTARVLECPAGMKVKGHGGSGAIVSYSARRHLAMSCPCDIASPSVTRASVQGFSPCWSWGAQQSAISARPDWWPVRAAATIVGVLPGA